MSSLETRILSFGKNIDAGVRNVSEQIEEIKKLLDVLAENKEFISEWDEDEDDDFNFDDEVWIKFPLLESKLVPYRNNEYKNKIN